MNHMVAVMDVVFINWVVELNSVCVTLLADLSYYRVVIQESYDGDVPLVDLLIALVVGREKIKVYSVFD